MVNWTAHWRPGKIRVLITMLVGFLCSGIGSISTTYADQLKITRDGELQTIEGQLLVIAQDESLLFRSTDGRLWVLEPGDYDEVIENEDEFQALSQEETEERLLAELPEGFRVHTTRNYVVAYNTSPAYARWVGALYERLYKGFKNYWKTRRFKLSSPDVPLVVLVFDNEANYSRYVVEELGQEPGTMVAYYNLFTNRVAMYDLTGAQDNEDVRNSRSSQQINTMLSQPNAFSMVATVIHEATHQLMFNCGMQQRLADTPLWLNEGLAMFFETPDLESRSGWRGMGKVNPLRLQQFRDSLRTRADDSLTTLIQDDKRFRDPAQSVEAYAEAWALAYFLLDRKQKDFVRYLEELSKMKPLDQKHPEQRLEVFEKHFGGLEQLNADLIEYLRHVD